MKLYNVKDVNGFCNMIDSCKGQVMLITPEGDRLNLKSKLSQYVSLANYFNAGQEQIPEIEIVAYEADDARKIMEFMIEE